MENKGGMNISQCVLGSQHKPGTKSDKNRKKCQANTKTQKSLRNISKSNAAVLKKEVIKSRQALLFGNTHQAISSPNSLPGTLHHICKSVSVKLKDI